MRRLPHQQDVRARALRCSACQAVKDAADERALAGLPSVQSGPPAVSPRLCVTTASIPGYALRESLGVVSAECAFGVNLFRDFFAGMTLAAATKSVVSGRLDAGWAGAMKPPVKPVGLLGPSRFPTIGQQFVRDRASVGSPPRCWYRHNRSQARLVGRPPWQAFHLRPLPQVQGSLRPRGASLSAYQSRIAVASCPVRSRAAIWRMGSSTCRKNRW
jgi:hypothetical protein